MSDNAIKCIQGAIFQIQNGNSALAIELLRTAKRLIKEVGEKSNNKPKERTL